MATTLVLFFLIKVLIWPWSSAVPHYVFMRGIGRSSSPPPPCWIAEERRFPASQFPSNETTITTKIDFAAVINNILQVLPETTNVAIVIGDSPIEQYWAEQIRVAFQPFESRLSFIWLNDLSLQDMLNRVATLPPRSAIYFAFILADVTNVAREEDTVFSRFYAVANAPIFSDRDG